MDDSPVRIPDLSARPFELTVERVLGAPPDVLFRAWTRHIDRWFAAPGSVLMRAEENEPFFFEAEGGGQRHPHYGRFLRLDTPRLIELTWVTGAGGTGGAETVLTVELAPADTGTRLRLTHRGFADAAARDAHREAWPMVLEQLDARTAGH